MDAVADDNVGELTGRCASREREKPRHVWVREKERLGLDNEMSGRTRYEANIGWSLRRGPPVGSSFGATSTESLRGSARLRLSEAPFGLTHSVASQRAAGAFWLRSLKGHSPAWRVRLPATPSIAGFAYGKNDKTQRSGWVFVSYFASPFF
jgi:hypothetical protein